LQLINSLLHRSSFVIKGLLIVIDGLLQLSNLLISLSNSVNIFIGLSLPFSSSIVHLSRMVIDGSLELILDILSLLFTCVDLNIQLLIHSLHLFQVLKLEILLSNLSVSLGNSVCSLVNSIVSVSDCLFLVIDLSSELVVLGSKFILIIFILSCSLGSFL